MKAQSILDNRTSLLSSLCARTSHHKLRIVNNMLYIYIYVCTSAAIIKKGTQFTARACLQRLHHPSPESTQPAASESRWSTA